MLSVASAKLNRGQIVLAASPHLEATRLAGAMLVGVLTPTIVEVCLVCRWRVRPTVCSSEVRHCVALVGRVVVVHVRIVSSERLSVKCKSGIVAWYTCCLLSPIACLVQATVGGFVKDNQDGDNEKSMHCCFFQRSVVVLYACIILSVSSIVKAHRMLFQNFWKVFYLPHGCRLASPTPIMARGIRIAASIAIVVMSIVLPFACCWLSRLLLTNRRCPKRLRKRLQSRL